MPSENQVFEHGEKLALLAKKLDFNLRGEFGAVKITFTPVANHSSQTIALSLVESLNCCGITNLRNFDDIRYWFEEYDSPPLKLSTISNREQLIYLILLEQAKLVAWNDPRSLLYASISLEDTPNWKAAFDKNGWKQEYRLVNRNTDNTIIVYSFNLNSWRPNLTTIRSLIPLAYPLKRR